MKAVFVDSDTKMLRVKDVAVPKPGKGEVLVQMIASVVNPSDLANIRELKPENAKDFIPGNEGCGIVVECGKGFLASFYKGKRVACVATQSNSGTWAEYMLTKAGSCFPFNKSIEDEQVAMAIVNPMTALALTEMVIKGRHKTVVISAAASSLGRIMNYLLEKEGVNVINIVNSDKNTDLGFQYVLNSNSPDFTSEFQHICQKMNVRLMFDAVGGDLLNHTINLLPESSEIIIYGNLSKSKVEFSPPDIVRSSKTIKGFFLGHWTHNIGVFNTILHLLKVNKLLKSGVKTNVQANITIDEINNAIEVYESNMGKGKVIIRF